MRTPDQPPHVDTAASGSGQDRADRAARLTGELLVGIPSPVHEKDHVTVSHPGDTLVQLQEVGGSVDQWPHQVPRRPGGTIVVARIETGRGVAPFAGGEIPLRCVHGRIVTAPLDRTHHPAEGRQPSQRPVEPVLLGVVLGPGLSPGMWCWRICGSGSG